MSTRLLLSAKESRTSRWLHWGILFLVYGITGSLSMFFGRMFLSGVLNIDGGFLAGPWTYRIAYILMVPPFYSITLIVVGTIFGKHGYFKRRVIRTWSRLITLHKVA